MFTKTQKYHSSISKTDFINSLTGNHVKIHNLDFEIFEKDGKLKIIPHAEQEKAIKTLPITDVDVKKTGDKTDVVITSKVRKLDAAVPLLVMMFCSFLFLASIIHLYVERERLITYTLLGISSFIFVVFYVRMQIGYFDYVRKINSYIRERVVTS